MDHRDEFGDGLTGLQRALQELAPAPPAPEHPAHHVPGGTGSRSAPGAAPRPGSGPRYPRGWPCCRSCWACCSPSRVSQRIVYVTPQDRGQGIDSELARTAQGTPRAFNQRHLYRSDNSVSWTTCQIGRHLGQAHCRRSPGDNWRCRTAGIRRRWPQAVPHKRPFRRFATMTGRRCSNTKT